MASPRPHTREFKDDARIRLGIAVTRAREAAGYPTRPPFLDATYGFGKRSLIKLEQGEPVGPSVYEAVARFLPGWDEDTPCSILEGAPPPPTKVEGGPAVDEAKPRNRVERAVLRKLPKDLTHEEIIDVLREVRSAADEDDDIGDQGPRVTGTEG